MRKKQEQQLYSECYTGKGGYGQIEHMIVSQITYDYLKKINMSNAEIVQLHKAVWDLALPLMQPSHRQKYSRSEANQIKTELEKKYALDDHNKLLEGEPAHINYEECIDTVIDSLNSHKRIAICGGLAAGKTTLAKRIKRIAKNRGYDVKIFDEYVNISQVANISTIQCIPYLPSNETCDLRVFLSVPQWRQTWNALKRLPTFHDTPGLFTQNRRLRERYSLSFQKSISDVVTEYSFGRAVLFDRFQKANVYESDSY